MFWGLLLHSKYLSVSLQDSSPTCFHRWPGHSEDSHPFNTFISSDNIDELSYTRTIFLSPSLPPKQLRWEKEIIRLEVLLDTGSGLILIPGDLKYHCCPPVRAGAYGGRSGINGVLAQACFKGGCQTHRVVISSASEGINRTDILNSCKNLHTSSLTCGSPVPVMA